MLLRKFGFIIFFKIILEKKKNGYKNILLNKILFLKKYLFVLWCFMWIYNIEWKLVYYVLKVFGILKGIFGFVKFFCKRFYCDFWFFVIV